MSNIIAGADGRYYMIEKEGVRLIDLPSTSYACDLIPADGMGSRDMESSATMFTPLVDDTGASFTMFKV